MSQQILIVDDDHYLLRLFSKAFQNAGFDVISASEVTEARALLAQYQPDLLVLDFGLPDGTGLDILQFVNPEKQPDVRSILITGNYLVRDMPESTLVDLLLLKPVSPRELISAGIKLLDNNAQNPQQTM